MQHSGPTLEHCDSQAAGTFYHVGRFDPDNPFEGMHAYVNVFASLALLGINPGAPRFNHFVLTNNIDFMASYLKSTRTILSTPGTFGYYISYNRVLIRKKTDRISFNQCHALFCLTEAFVVVFAVCSHGACGARRRQRPGQCL